MFTLNVTKGWSVYELHAYKYKKLMLKYPFIFNVLRIIENLILMGTGVTL